jgi:ankyrin repeat protein/phosphohistidine phosphatase SixA
MDKAIIINRINSYLQSKPFGSDIVNPQQLDDFIRKNHGDEQILSKFMVHFIIPSIVSNYPEVLEYYFDIINVNGLYPYSDDIGNSYHTYKYFIKIPFINFVIYEKVSHMLSNLYIKSTYLKNPNIESFLRRGLNPNTILLEGISLLQYALTISNLDLVSELLKFGADPNFKTPIGENLIEFAVCSLDNYDKTLPILLNISSLKWNMTENLLIKKYPIVNKYDLLNKCEASSIKEYMIKVAFEKCDAETIESIIIKFGILVLGKYPLHQVCENKHSIRLAQAKIALLLKYGVDINELDAEGNTCLQCFIKHSFTNNFVVAYAFVEFLVNSGCSIHNINSKGESVLHMLTWNGDTELSIIRYLVLKGIDLNVGNNSLLQIWKDNKEKVKILADYGVVDPTNQIYAEINTMMQNFSLSCDNVRHLLFFINKIKEIESQVGQLVEKQYFVINKSYNKFHSYWQKCQVFETYDVLCAKLLSKVYELLTSDMQELREFKYISDSNILFGIMAAKIELLKDEWININAVEEKYDVIDSLVLENKVKSGSESKKYDNDSMALKWLGVCGKKRRRINYSCSKPSITLMRHAETEWNAGINRVDTDSILTDNGKALAKGISGYYDIVVCSTLKRTIQTLEFSNIKYGSLLRTGWCNEVDGKTPVQVVIKNVAEFDKYIKNLDPIKNKILVISHMHFIKKFSGVKLKNLEQVEHVIDDNEVL